MSDYDKGLLRAADAELIGFALWWNKHPDCAMRPDCAEKALKEWKEASQPVRKDDYDALKAYAQRKEAELSDAVHLNDEQSQRVYKAERERDALIAGLREIATCESKVKGDVVDIAKSLLWKHDK